VVPVGQEGVLLVMPALLNARDDPRLGAKLVTVYPGNPARGRPTIHASYTLMDATTGQPLALLEGTFLTGLRTGATSALAARRLARPDARRVACFGAGVQAGFQLAGLAAVRPLTHVTVVGRDLQRAGQFAAAVRSRLGLTVEVAVDARSAAAGADIITCATTSPIPVVFGADVRPGTHVDLVGAFRATDREADTELMRRARVVVDTYEGALSEAGDLLIPMGEGAFGRDHIAADLTQLVTGGGGRGSADEITVFKSVGWALEDLATARLAYNRAHRQGIGTEVSL
jgi:ornithine cyclodeaminase